MCKSLKDFSMYIAISKVVIFEQSPIQYTVRCSTVFSFSNKLSQTSRIAISTKNNLLLIE